MDKLLLLKTPTTPKLNEAKTTTICKSNFNFCYVIGKGGFGKVWKVQYKKTKEVFALKEMSKLKIIDKKSEKSINSEREFLSQLHHPFIVNMHYAFQDKDNLYLVMDMLSGGDLRYHISRYRRFSEEQTRFFIACMVYTLEYIHANKVIHRDIKPENLVLDDKGYVRITDFGIAKENLEDNSSETSGTPGYMSPEVMRGKNHSFPVDFFAIGVIGYEFMIGKRPYYGKNRKEIKEQIFTKQACIKKEDLLKGWSNESADFINKLLIRKQENRLGFKNGAKELREHPWLKYYPWKELEGKTLPAPFMPENKDNFDKRYCESVDKITEETKMRYENIMCGDAIKKAFVKFYFNKDEMKDRKNHNEKPVNPSNKSSNNNLNLNSTTKNNSCNSSSTNIINNYFNNSDKINNKENNVKEKQEKEKDKDKEKEKNTNLNLNQGNSNSSTNLSNTKMQKKHISHSKSEKEIINVNNIHNINNINNNVINIIDNSNNPNSILNNNNLSSKNSYYYIQKSNKNNSCKNINNKNYINNINCNLSHNSSAKNISNNNSLMNANNNSCLISSNSNSNLNNQFDKLKNANIFTNLKQTKYLFNYPKSNKNYVRSSSVINLKNNNNCNNLASNNIMLNNNGNGNNSSYHFYMNKLNNSSKICYNSNNNSNFVKGVNNSNNGNTTHKRLNRVNSASKILGRSPKDYIIDNGNISKGLSNSKNKYIK